MKLQNYERRNKIIRENFLKMKSEHPNQFKRRLNLAWSNWGFGLEKFEDSAERLSKAGMQFIEIHGNKYGDDLGYNPREVNKILSDHNIKVSGICGMFASDCDLSSNRGIFRQNAIDYIRRNIALGKEICATYFLIVPGAVGRPQKIDAAEFDRSVETLRLVADDFIKAKIRGAVEPIRSAEVSLCHTVDDALKYIKALDHPGVQHINGDVYHMLSEENHIGEAILKAGERLINLHLADSNRRALGDGCLDIDTMIMALYLTGYNREGCFATAEPLGPGGDPYPVMYERPDRKVLDQLVQKTVFYFREREEEVLAL